MKTYHFSEKTLAQFKAFFESTELPLSLRLNECSVIVDMGKFVSSHLETVRASMNADGKLNDTHLPYWERLVTVYKLLN